MATITPAAVDAAPAAWSARKVAVWTALAVVLLIARGPGFAASFRPPPGFTGDFAQDWASARNVWSGHPVYESTPEAFARHAGPTTDVLPRNAHSPGSVLFVLPFA